MTPAPPPEPPKPIEVAQPEPAPAPEPAVPKVVEAVPTLTADDAGDLKEAIARAQRPVEATPDGSWTLQLSAYQDKAEAGRFASDLRGKGYAPYVVEAHVSGKGTWYRVRMGSFETKEKAAHYLADFKRETKLDAFVAGSE